MGEDVRHRACGAARQRVRVERGLLQGRRERVDGQSLANLVDEIERGVINDTMTRYSGNISESARVLGLTRRGLYLKLRRLGIESGVLVDTK